MVVSGIASIQFTGSSILISQPENGALVTEYAASGREGRSFGELRATGHEADRDLHLALNSGIPLVDPSAGSSSCSTPAFRCFANTTAMAACVFERRMQGAETDRIIERLPAQWPRRDGELRGRALDRARRGRRSPRQPVGLASSIPTRTSSIRRATRFGRCSSAASTSIAPTGLFFTANDRLLVTPGLFEFDPR